MPVKTLKVIIILFFFLPFSSILAAESLDVVINEIAWMGTENSYNDEWIELYNNSSFDLEIEGWKLIATDGTPAISLKGKIPARNFFLLERTDDQPLSSIEADLIYKGSLKNQGEYLKLITQEGKVIDKIDCSSDWFAGDNKTKRTMERKNPLIFGNDAQNWQTSQYSGGTPKAENSLKAEDSQEEKEPETKEKETLKLEEKVITYPSNIFINEVLPSPEGSDAENEWIEIFNQNGFEVDLSDWRISDIVGRTKVYTFPKGTIIEAKGFLVFWRPTSKITLNNDQDSLELLWPDGKIINKVSYQKAPRGESFNRTDSGWFWASAPTPGAANIIPFSFPSKKAQEKTEGQIQETEASSDFQTEKGIAAISEQIPKSSNFLFVLLVALTIAFLSGIIILFVRKKVKSKPL